MLSGRQAQALGMALHELTTNAAKYGALSHPDGRLGVRWTVDQDGTCTLVWTESGLVGIGAARSEGFGSTLIDRILPAEIAGTVERAFSPTGLVCTIRFPVETDAHA